MEGVTGAVLIVRTVAAGSAFAVVGAIDFKAVFPNVFKIVAADVTLYQFGATLDV